MGIGSIFKKLTAPMPEQKIYPKITGDERELMSYQERERLQQVRKNLAQYRKRDYDEQWGEGKIMKKSKNIIINQPNVFTKTKSPFRMMR